MDQQKRIEFYKACGMTDREIQKRLEQQRKTELWTKKVLDGKPVLEKLAKAGAVLKWIEVGLILFTFFLTYIESVEVFIKNHLGGFAIYLGVNFVLLTIGFVLSQINIHNETYHRVKENKEYFDNIKQKLGE